jgi:hypothetical protein
MSNLPGNLEKVKALVEHPSFDIKNPNKIYSLLGGFCASSVNFHNADGSGYAFLGDLVMTLDKINPQVSERERPSLRPPRMRARPPQLLAASTFALNAAQCSGSIPALLPFQRPIHGDRILSNRASGASKETAASRAITLPPRVPSSSCHWMRCTPAGGGAHGEAVHPLAQVRRAAAGAAQGAALEDPRRQRREREHLRDRVQEPVKHP